MTNQSEPLSDALVARLVARVDPPGCGCTDCLTGYSRPDDPGPNWVTLTPAEWQRLRGCAVPIELRLAVERILADRIRNELERAAQVIEMHSGAEFMDGDVSPARGTAFARAAEIVRGLRG